MYIGEDIKQQREARANNIVKGFSNSDDLLEKAHNHGDVHPNGKWYWESSAAGGKGDWRTIKGAGKAAPAATPTKHQPKAEEKKEDDKNKEEKHESDVKAIEHKFDLEDDTYVKRGDKTLKWYSLSVEINGKKYTGQANQFWQSANLSKTSIGGYEIVIDKYKNDVNIAKEGHEPKTLEEAKKFFLSEVKKINGK